MTATASDTPAPAPADAPTRPKSLAGWRLLALVYDFFPVLALWFVVGLVAVALHGGETIRADTLAGWLELLALWAITGLYAVLSWRNGGQTLGMRPWRLRVTAADGSAPSWRALWLRFAVATLSLLPGGLGFWWAWIDRDRLAWHDRASGTRMVRVAKG